MDHLCYLCIMFVMPWCLLIAALWSPAGKGLISWLLFVMFNCVFVTFPYGILDQVWYLIVLILIQLMHSFEVNIRICQLENSDVHRGEAEVNITFEG